MNELRAVLSELGGTVNSKKCESARVRIEFSQRISCSLTCLHGIVFLDGVIAGFFSLHFLTVRPSFFFLPKL